MNDVMGIIYTSKDDLTMRELTSQRAVAEVILNRVDHPRFPKSVCGVVNQSGQFTYKKTRSRERGAFARATGGNINLYPRIGLLELTRPGLHHRIERKRTRNPYRAVKRLRRTCAERQRQQHANR